jgi:hypothetical protein
MKKVLLAVTSILVLMGFVTALALGADDEATARKLVDKLKGTKHHHPKYYTGKHGFMNDEDITTDHGTLEKGTHIMSWLVLDPPIVGEGGPAANFKGNDVLKKHWRAGEEEVTKDPKNWPIAGEKLSGSSGIASDGSWWIPINFQDLVEAGQGALFASGNQFDWLEWGGGGLNQFIEYLFCLVKWDKGGTVTFKVGSDDPETTWVNGKIVTEALADRNWPGSIDTGEIKVPAGEWVAILGKVGENGGECGYTLMVDPPPDDHTLDTEKALAVNPGNKLPTSWGAIKAMRLR